MSSLTKEQELAVQKKDTNIIVSAGAGSGKTTVLKKRVERILLSGVNINELIILTFTNNAAAEMKERIRKIINDNPKLARQSELLDSAYITTFDSFAQSLVKKYNYLLGINKNFQIVDDSIINLEMSKIIEGIFEELYRDKDEDFIKLVGDFEVKDDKKIREAVKLFYKNITNIIDRRSFLTNYVEKFYSEEFIDESFSLFEDMLFSIRDKFVTFLEELMEETLKEETLSILSGMIENFSYAASYDDFLGLASTSLPAARNGVFTDAGKELKKQTDDVRKLLFSYVSEDKKELICHYKSTLPYARAFTKILLRLDDELNRLKRENNIFQFFDIAFLAIDLVKNNESVRNEIKNNTYEIMIDEYQDTNDIQEEFISYIQNNNVYTVGDVKQSIYRFRNANPYIFKNRYDEYSRGIKGFKIDLNKNFRSRSEVIEDINCIFNNIMFDSVGGADYKNSHQMIFGNTAYLNHLNNLSYKTEILSYDTDGTTIKDSDAEAFIIALDILTRIHNQEKVTFIDKNEMKTRVVDYKDFCILVDKSRNFELLKKVLEYKGIPCTIYKDIIINDEDEVYILKNLISLIIHVKEGTFDNDFKHVFLSVARSYVHKMSDGDIYEVVTNSLYEETDLYKKALEISSQIDALSNELIFDLIVDKFDVINKINLVGDVDERLTKLEYFRNNLESLNEIGFNIYEVSPYFDDLLLSGEKISMSTNKDVSSNTVKIMTIHGSKGLEYPYVYLPYLGSDIKRDANNSRFKYSSKFGFILPFYKDGVGSTFMSLVHKRNEEKEAMSEKIRLFYVALTRAKEKIIMINKFSKKIDGLKEIDEEAILNVKSIGEILSLMKYKLCSYIREVDLESLLISSDYNLVKLTNYKEKIRDCKDKIIVKNVKFSSDLVENKHFSKALTTVVKRDLKKRLDFGTFMHYVFEIYDFKNNNLDSIDIGDEYKECVRKFLCHEEVKDINKAKCYKEYEIMFKKDGGVYHGFVDLLVEYEEYYDIIDYKLSNINSDEYVRQLSGYRDYIESNYKKRCNIYLYSIKKDIFKKLN